MSVTIRARVIRNKYPKNNSLTVTLEDAQSGKSFTNFESFTGDASTIALYFASSIFADSTPRPSSFLLDSLNFTFGLLRLNSNNFRQERQGKILMTEEEATNNVKELKKINKTIIENLGDIKLGKLLTELKSKNAISIGDKSEDILSLETFNKINKTNLLVKDLRNYDKLKEFSGQDYLKVGSKTTPQSDEQPINFSSVMNAFDNSKMIFNSNFLKDNIEIKSNLIKINTEKYLSDLFEEDNYPRIEDENFPFLASESKERLDIDETEKALEDFILSDEFVNKGGYKETIETLMNNEDEDTQKEIDAASNKAKLILLHLRDKDFYDNFSDISNTFVLDKKIGGNDFKAFVRLVKKIIEIQKEKEKDRGDLESDSSSTIKQEKKEEVLYDSILKTISILKKSLNKNNLIVIKRTIKKEEEEEEGEERFVEEKGYEVHSIFGTEKRGLSLEEAYEIIKEDNAKLSTASGIKDLIRNDIRSYESFDVLHDTIISYLTPNNQELEVGILNISFSLSKSKILDSFENFKEYMFFDKQVGIKVGIDEELNADVLDSRLAGSSALRPKDFGTRFGDAAIAEAKKYRKLIEQISKFEEYIENSFLTNPYYKFQKTGFENTKGMDSEDLLELIFDSGNTRFLRDGILNGIETVNDILEGIEDSIDANQKLQSGYKSQNEEDSNIYISGENARNAIEENTEDEDVVEGFQNYLKIINRLSNYNFDDKRFDIDSIFYFSSEEVLNEFKTELEKIKQMLVKIKDGSTKLKYNLLDLWYDYSIRSEDNDAAFIEMFEEDELDTSERLKDKGSPVDVLRDISEVGIVKINKISLESPKKIKVFERAGKTTNRIFSGTGSKVSRKLNSRDTYSLLAASANYENLREAI